MSSNSHIQRLLQKLKLPAQSQTSLKFCESSRASAVANWAAQLPATQVNRTSVLLYQALPEVSHLDVATSTRLKMLEHLRPYVQDSIQGLSQKFLNQPLSLPEAAMKSAIIAQALQKHMTNSYCHVINDTLSSRPLKKLKKQDLNELCHALHRALTGMGLQILRSAQLYTQASSQVWLEMHSLYQIAQVLELTEQHWPDESAKDSKITITQIYLRSLLLASAQPNKLRQQAVLDLYNVLAGWSKLVRIEAHSQSSENLLAINIRRGEGPVYKAQLSDKILQRDAEFIRALNLDSLLDALNKQSEKDREQPLLDIPRGLGNITDHLADCWGQHHQRRYHRSQINERLEVTIGLSNIHFNVSGELEFKKFLLPRDRDHDSDFGLSLNVDSRFSAHDTGEAEDPWNNAFDAPSHNTLPDLDVSFANETDDGHQQLQQRHPVIEVQVHDSSPGGYCLSWHQQIPQQVKAGELIGIREPNRRQWSVGIIRWVRQVKNGSQTGVEIIATEVSPMAIKQLHKLDDDGDFMRALLASPINAVEQPPTLITAAVPFREKNKVVLNERGSENTAHLTEKLMGTAAASQFCFRKLANTPAEETPAADFPSSW